MNADEPPGMEAARRLIHEKRIVARLAGMQGVACLLVEQDGLIGVQDHEGRALSQVLANGALEVRHVLTLALQLAQTLAAMHRRGVLHQNINPDHILLQHPGGRPLLVGFHLATTFAEERPGFTHHSEIRGNLTYLAPEHTGRTGRSVDLRADLYSLGATIYEAATGRPPFEAHDPLQLLHDHLARVPAPPVQLQADLPEALSQLILRLLEKEPERRYQSAEGLIHDLAQIQRAVELGEAMPLRLGEHDFPMQLVAPARLVGRDAEIGELRQALEDAVHGDGRIVLVTGVPGVGKTSLINELRTMVTARRGWFVSGKFDQYRRGASTAPAQAFRALGRLLLAEPESELASQRERILEALGSNAGLMTTAREYALLLGPQPPVPAVDLAQAESRLLTTAVALLRAIVSPERPLVMVLDDLQWAGTLSVRFLEMLQDAHGLPGLLLVGSYRDGEVDAAHPLTVLLSRRNALAQVPLQLHLMNLPESDLRELLREMIRLPPDRAAVLAHAVGQHTGGNPYDTVELLNALRQEGTLRPGASGWEWDSETLRRYVGQSGVLDLLAARIARLPAPSRNLLHAVACLGGKVPLRLLGAALGASAGELEEQLAASLEDGLLTMEPGEDRALCMRHDRVQQAVYGNLDPAERRALHLGLARRLGATAEFKAAAVQQYLPAVEEITLPDECRNVARLLQSIAVRMWSAADYTGTQRLVEAAMLLVSRLPAPTPADLALRDTLAIANHVALCSLGRFEEADALYGPIAGRGAPVEDWVDAACAQIDGLSSRSRPLEAVELGLSLLRQLGLAVPDDFEASDIKQRLADIAPWIEELDVGQDLRPYTGDQRSKAASRLINRLAYCAYFSNLPTMAWLLLEARLLWIGNGPSPELVPALAALGAVAVGLNQDYRTAYFGSRHVLGVSEARGWETSTSEARFLLGSHASHWFEPLEQGLRRLHLARDGMLRNGELQSACFCHRPTTTAMLDCSPTMQGWAEEVESGMALAVRLRNDYVIAMMSVDRDLIRGLRGGANPADAPPLDTQPSIERQSGQPAVSLSIHFCRALLAAVFGDAPALERHTSAAMKYVPVLANYRSAQARLLHALSLAQSVKSAVPGERQARCEQLNESCEWLAQRAADAPDNFLHCLLWIEAERAWANDDFRAAAQGFDSALRQVKTLNRPWHHAMITERAGLFYLEHGLGTSGEQFVAQARDLYRAWGAEAKARALESMHAFLAAGTGEAQEPPESADTPRAPVDTIEALAILRASQALSSETSLARLKARVVDVMAALTGATGVRLVLWDEDIKGWYLSDGDGAERIPLEPGGARGLLPLSAFRYAERTREPLLLTDAVTDDRFSRDVYFQHMERCSLMAVPILHHGVPRAMLILENRAGRGAFNTARLDAVMMIAGQLAVSLESAQLYERMEHKVREQTQQLREAQSRWIDEARRAGMAQIATNVLHNVGNVLNSVNVSAHVLTAKVRQSRAGLVGEVAGLLEGNERDLGTFFEQDRKGRLLPKYLRDLAHALDGERDDLLGELHRLGASVEHIKNVVAMQQSYAGARGVLEPTRPNELVDDALRIQEDALARDQIQVARDYAQMPAYAIDRTRIMQVLVNLLENARHAMQDMQAERRLKVALSQEAGWLQMHVSDNGCGIKAENLSKIFAHGFTTKSEGHGFGLHSCAMAAREMGGTLAVRSEGEGLGATFTLALPLVS